MINVLKKELKKKLPIQRFNHCIETQKMAILLAKQHKVDEEQCSIGGLLHDCGYAFTYTEMLEMKKLYNLNVDELEESNVSLLHASISAAFVENNMEVKNKEILDAIRFHTTANKNMSKISMIVYLADKIEFTRNYPNVKEIREKAFIDLKMAILCILEKKINFCLNNNFTIHPRSIIARNEFLKKIRKNA